MPGPEVTLADVQRRAADNPNARYRAFDTYPWAKDPVFTEQLSSALNNAKSNGLSLSETALETRIQRFAQQTQIAIDGEAYKKWLSQTNSQPPRIISEEAVAVEVMTVPKLEDRKFAHLLVELGDALGQLALDQTVPVPVDTSVPSWQSAAPTAELYIKKDSTSADPGKEPYPKKFEEIVEFLQSGKPIPGIKQIPDTVIEDPAFTTHGRLTAPPKPWEIGRTPSTENSEPLATESRA
ncbi:uncharacterized protein GGS22DRAFT_143951 [Annulohypoxylon maeteangense]|uniref:uncharacterized protein n=1 Tax=Annulohypoxylon maeteangense TaxID=1927788 RepID=UPI002007AADA|nr:uncharacterized protein GGS22DRAFT_143951 [Annulohypoxylon maeteangense]KAI0884537.1 hypothetical protein GGS22DRAFT_143951 [Annulohypoxylon maeteangense]